MYIPFCVRLATQAQCARGLRPPIAQPRVRLAVIVCLGILFTAVLLLQCRLQPGRRHQSPRLFPCAHAAAPQAWDYELLYTNLPHALLRTVLSARIHARLAATPFIRVNPIAPHVTQQT